MFGLFGKNKDRNTRIVAWFLGIAVSISMILASFSLLI